MFDQRGVGFSTPNLDCPESTAAWYDNIDKPITFKERMDLDNIQVVRSPLCRPSSDCWEVELYFFFPDRQVQTVRKVYRFTVDVSDTVPVTVGPVRAWFTR